MNQVVNGVVSAWTYAEPKVYCFYFSWNFSSGVQCIIKFEQSLDRFWILLWGLLVSSKSAQIALETPMWPYRAWLQEFDHVQRLFYIRNLLLQTCKSSLCVDFHKSVLSKHDIRITNMMSYFRIIILRNWIKNYGNGQRTRPFLGNLSSGSRLLLVTTHSLRLDQ